MSRFRRVRVHAFSVAAVVAAGSLGAGLLPASAHALEPGPAAVGSTIPGQWIVTLAPQMSAASVGDVAKTARAAGGRVLFEYSSALRGFAATLSPAAVRKLAADPAVQSIEADTVVRASGTQNPVPSWGLDRIDQSALPLNNTYSYAATGSGVRAYIVDTGIRASHTDFGGRVQSGYTAISDGNGTADCNGHGTHVAGTVGGAKYGVAKSVTLVPVRVLGCDGSGANSGVIAGLDWVTAQRKANGLPSVVNMSLGGAVSTSLDAAVSRAVAAGVSVAVAAGNDNTDACAQSPARVGGAVTVGATTSSDGRASYSNYGSCVDLFAPGSSIVSDSSSSDTGSATMSGTSMATPHVAGVIAAYLQGKPTATPAQVSSALSDNSILGLLSGLLGSVNRLLHTITAPPPPPPPPPPAPTDPVTIPGGYTTLAPARLLDTRNGTGVAAGAVAGQQTVRLPVLGRGGVPSSGVSAVAMNVTVTQPSTAGYITAFGSGSVPATANLNFVAGQTVPNLVVVPVAGDGTVSLFNGAAGSVHLVADVAGWFRSGTVTAPGAFSVLAPARLLDTRDGTGVAAGAVAGQQTVRLPVLGRGGVPSSGVSAVVMNLTVTQPSTAGYITAFGSGSVPLAANLNYVAGQTVPNLVVVPVAGDGTVSLFNGGSGTVHLVGDVAGWFKSGTVTAAGGFTSVAPARMLDTRNGTGVAAGAVGGQESVRLPVLGRGGVPASGVSAVVLNVTVTQPSSAGYITAFGSGSVPLAANLNYVAGQTVPNLVVVPVAGDGTVSLFNGGSGSVHLVADVAGWVRGTAS